ncbi:MAG: efflux RND transporter periplasmic adaptor subunit [Chloroflexi bacterium OHK40]
MTVPPARRRRLPWRRLLTGLALLLVIGACVAAVIARQQIVRPPTLPQPEIIVVPVERGTLSETVEVNGALEPRDRARVSFPAGARVAEVLVARGDEVAEGAVLARLETRDLDLKVASARAELDQAQQTLDKLLAGPTEADLAQAAAAVARARANLAADSQSVQPLDVEVARARRDSARQRLADLERGLAPDDLRSAEAGLLSAQEALTQARISLETTRDSASRAKTNAAQALEQGVQELERVQRAYSDAFWDWDFVQRTGRHPTEKIVDESGVARNRELEDREVEAFRRAFADAGVNLRNAEQSVQNLSEAYEQAREDEVREIQAAERAVAAAERDVAEAQRTFDTARTRGVEAALLEARQAVAEAERAYVELVDNPERPARRAELEAALLEAIAAEEQLKAGPDPVELARARTALEQARAALAEAEAELDAATLRAPIAGTITDISLKPGTLTTADDAIAIADLRGFLIRGQVTEQDVARVAAGQQVLVSVDSVPGESFTGELLLVGDLPSESGQQDPGGGFGMPFPSGALGGLYPVEIALQVSDERLRVGMATTASIQILSIEDTLIIPLQAVEYGPEGPQVRLASGTGPDGQPTGELVPVELGVTSGDRVQVLGGINEGDSIILPTLPPMEGPPGFVGG